MMLKKLSHWSAAAVIGLSSFSAHATFTITLDLTAVGATYQPYFSAAKTFWEGAITGYQGTNINGLTGVSITASTPSIDGPGLTLGSAGPSGFVVSQDGFKFIPTGAMRFDSADLTTMVNNGTITDVIKHEMAHVLGFGTLWTLNNLYVDGSGKYTGANALAQYKTEYSQPAATTFIPVELEGGLGTANGHWDEVNNGTGLTGRTDPLGRDMKFELMTGWINSPGTYVSRTTLASFQDLGYTVNLSAVPEPGTLALWLLGIPVVARLASRRRVGA